MAFGAGGGRGGTMRGGAPGGPPPATGPVTAPDPKLLGRVGRLFKPYAAGWR